jgi:hypothetical protein
MGVSPQQTWRGSYLDSTSNPQAKSACMKIVNGAIVIFGISYLLYVLVIAIGPLVQPAHNAVKLRVHLRSGTGLPVGEGAERGASQKNGKDLDSASGRWKAVMPGHNQAPSLQTGMQPELEALTGEGAGKVTSDSAVAGGQAASKEGKAFQQPLKQKGSGLADQPSKLEVQEDRKTAASEQVGKGLAAGKGSKGGWKGEGRDEKDVEVEKELMISQQQREQLEKQLKSNFDGVSQS